MGRNDAKGWIADTTPEELCTLDAMATGLGCVVTNFKETTFWIIGEIGRLGYVFWNDYVIFGKYLFQISL
jgi:hypothetical protein